MNDLKSATTEKSIILTQNSQEKAIIKIIEDHIIFTRFYDGLYTILNAYAPNETCHELKVSHNGIEAAIIIMGIEDKDLKDKLDDTYHDCACVKENELISIPELAQTIYLKWLNEIKNYFLTPKVA